MKVSIVIPRYNERATIEEVVKAIRAGPVQGIAIIVVDDGSTDGTKELLTMEEPTTKGRRSVGKMVWRQRMLSLNTMCSARSLNRVLVKSMLRKKSEAECTRVRCGR